MEQTNASRLRLSKSDGATELICCDNFLCLENPGSVQNPGGPYCHGGLQFINNAKGCSMHIFHFFVDLVYKKVEESCVFTLRKDRATIL